MWFFSKSKGTATLQTLNLAAMAVALYELGTNPDASIFEVGADVFVHGATVLTLREDGHFLEGLGSFSLNMMRVGGILHSLALGCTSFPKVALASDFVLHLLGAAFNLVIACGEESNKNTLSTAAKTQ